MDASLASDDCEYYPPSAAAFAIPSFGQTTAAAGHTGTGAESDVDYEADSDYSDDSSLAARRRRKAASAAKGGGGTASPGGIRKPAGGAGGTRVLQRWSAEEHAKLEALVKQYGTERNWALIAESIRGRSGKQCRERWLNHMRDGIIKCVWSI